MARDILNRYTGKSTADIDSGDLELKDCRIESTDITSNMRNIVAPGFYSSKTCIFANSGAIDLNGEFSVELIIHSNFCSVILSTWNPKDNYVYDISTTFGHIMLDNYKLRHNPSAKSEGTSENSLKIEASSGDVEVYFVQ